MSKSIVIDFIVLKKLGLGIKDFLFLVSLYKEYPILDDFNFVGLAEKKYIKLDEEGNPHLRQSAIDLISFLEINTFGELQSEKVIKKSKKKINAEVTARVDEYRNKWKGLKPGAMGGRQSCIDKLSRWMDENPEYSFDDILKAADLYLSTEGTNIRYLQKADYFVYKQENNKEESSRLSAFVDDISIESGYSDWTSTLR